VEDVEDEPLFAERVAGIDIGKAAVMVTIRVPGDTRRGLRQQETREFRSVRKHLLALAGWLRGWQVTKVGMEATGDCWKPVYFLLEREALTARCITPRRSRRCPDGPRPTSSGLGVAGEDHRARAAAGQLRAAGGHPAAAHPCPLPQAPDPGPHRGEGAVREAAGRRAPEGSHGLPPQAGIGVYERGTDGRLAAACVYDDIDAPIGHP
jgi:hypothetical protein